MKESVLIQMQNKIETLGRVNNQLVQEVDLLKTMVMGDHALIQKMPGFEEAMENLKDEYGKEEETSE